MTPEVSRLLSYMAAFSRFVANRHKVALLMDLLENAPSIGAIVTSDRTSQFGTKSALAQMALQAVEFCDGSGFVPEWITQAGVDVTKMN